ncbi:MAG: 2Fe-2S iron-sulfur cluster binding domain-containing protein [Spirochaetia bacterium]|jgi:Na+-transporting NADH:ubiquinone oxidoreductase subunit F
MRRGPKIIVNDGERVLEAEAGKPLLFTAMAAKIFIPSACGGRASCGQCRVRVLSGASEHVSEERALLGADEIARGVHLACQLKVTGETRIEMPDGYLRARQYHTTVARIRELAKDMREVELALLEPPRLSFLAGQYVQFIRPSSESDPRPLYRAYSMASPPSSDSRLSLLFARVPEGECTSYVFERLHPGEAVTINGPFGVFQLRESDRPIIFVAGGSGIAPIRAILIDMAENRITRPAAFFFSAHAVADLVYAEDMRALERRLPAFSFIPVLSRPAPEDRWEGQTGGLPAALTRLMPDLDDHEAYLCGGPGLIDASINALKAKGLRDERIFFDKFS